MAPATELCASLEKSDALSSTDGFSTARRILLDASGLDQTALDRAMARLARRRVDWADIYLEETVSRDWVLEESRIKTGSFTIDRGTGLRTVLGERASLAYSNALSSAALLRAASTASAMTQTGVLSADKESLVTSDTSFRQPRDRLPALYEPIDETDEIASVKQLNLLNFVDKTARALDSAVTDVLATYQTERSALMLSGLDGRLQGDVRPMSYLSITVTVERNGRRERATAGGGARAGIAYFSADRIRRWISLAVSEALHNLNAIPAPAGVFPVVLGPGWPGILLHEAVGHGLEGDFIRKGTSVFSNRFGELVAAPGVSVIDDGTIPGRRGSLLFDDEGTPTQRNVLIENGRLVGTMLDIVNARLVRRATTGNGRRESFASLPMPRMTNTFLLPGTYDPQEIIASVPYGIYAENFNGGQVDITNGQFVFNMSKAWLIEKGRLTRPVKGAMLSGDGKTALRKIRMIGRDLALDEGMGQCGKDGQQIPVGVGMPTVRIDSLSVGGTAVG